MKRIQLPCTVLITALVLTASSPGLEGTETKLPTKQEAAKLLTSMGYEDVIIGAVVEGIPVLGGHNGATVVGICRREGKIQKIEASLNYDSDMGWFYYEFDEPVTKLRLWSSSGYSEIYPKFSLTDSAAAEKIVGSWKDGSNLLIYTKDGQWKQILKGSASAGTWKCEGGAIVAAEPTKRTKMRHQILALDESRLVLRIKAADGHDVTITFSRIADNAAGTQK
jgi:hypothetical protein